MRTFKNYIDAAKRRKLEETGEEGFSLIELIIVVVILGILVAIAIPIFGNIQAAAQKNAVKAARGRRCRRSLGSTRGQRCGDDARRPRLRLTQAARSLSPSLARRRQSTMCA